MIPKQRSVTLVFGEGESGKTTFGILYLIRAKGVSCRFIFDPDNEFSDRLGIKPAGTPLEVEIAIRQGWVCFDPSILFGAKTAEGLAAFADIARQFAPRLPGRKIIVVDEVWRHISNQKVPDELLEVVKTGRKVGLQSLFLTQEPRELNETLLAEGTEFVCFRLQGVNSLERLERYNVPHLEEFRQLQKGHFVAWNKQTGGVRRGQLF